jgi:hypothetical protein
MDGRIVSSDVVRETPELKPFAQRCLKRFFTAGGFCFLNRAFR